MLAREAFGAAVQAFVRAERELAEARLRVRNLEAELTAGRAGRFNAATEIQALAAHRRECAAEVEAEKGLQAAQNAMNQRRLEYLDAHRRVEVVQRLEEKARTLHRQAAAHEEQAEFDDFASRRFIRRLRSA